MRWYDSDEIRAILAEPPFYPDEARTQRLLDDDVAAMLDDLQDAIVGPARIDAEQLEAWEESRARDYDVTDDVPY